jgi:hypothetical protein
MGVPHQTDDLATDGKADSGNVTSRIDYPLLLTARPTLVIQFELVNMVAYVHTTYTAHERAARTS